MARTKGAKNADHAERRAELLERLRGRLASRAGGPPSFRELAHAAGVSVATLTHHFGSRDGVIAAVLEQLGQDGRPFLSLAATPSGGLEQSLRDFLSFAAQGHRRGVGDLHAIGLLEGTAHAAHGPAYLTHILEPVLNALEHRLAAHVERGEMRTTNLRHAALMLLSPLLLAQLHQDQLGGCGVRPLDLETMIDDQVAAFLRAYVA